MSSPPPPLASDRGGKSIALLKRGKEGGGDKKLSENCGIFVHLLATKKTLSEKSHAVRHGRGHEARHGTAHSECAS